MEVDGHTIASDGNLKDAGSIVCRQPDSACKGGQPLHEDSTGFLISILTTVVCVQAT